MISLLARSAFLRIPVLLCCSLLLSRPLAAGNVAPLDASSLPTPDYAQTVGIHGLRHWKRMPVRVFFTPGAAATPERRAAARAGLDEWVQATGGVISYQSVDTPARADISVAFSADGYLEREPGEAGHTDVAFSGQTLRRARIEIAARGATLNQLQGVAAHEFGHALGIDGHSDDSDDLMAPAQLRVYAPDGTPIDAPIQTVTMRDLNTLKFCYSPLFSHTAASTRPRSF